MPSEGALGFAHGGSLDRQLLFSRVQLIAEGIYLEPLLIASPFLLRSTSWLALLAAARSFFYVNAAK